MTPQQITDHLESIAPFKDFAVRTAELTAALASAGAGIETIEPVLRFMEDNPSADFGTPGALVHFVEGFYSIRAFASR